MTINRACIILGVVLFAVGIWLSMRKPLWCDELYGQKITIEGSSWGKVLTGRINDEGNNFPLYYVLQKAMMSVIRLPLPDDLGKDFQLPVIHRKYNHLIYPRGQILLRLLPDILMTSAIVLLVRFWWVRQGVVVGLIALLSALSSGMVWWYWVEARPYPLWFLLTLLQALFLIEILSEPGTSYRSKVYLMAVNCCLAITATLGFIQVIIVQTILFVFGQRRLGYHVCAGMLPVGGALFLLSGRSANPLYIAMDPMHIVRLNFSYQQLALLFFYLTAFFCRRAWGRRDNGSEKRLWKGLAHLLNLLVGFFLLIAVLVYVSWHWPGRHGGFPVLGRHFLYLSALSVVMVPAMFSDLWSRSKGSPLWQGIFLFFFLMLLSSQLIEEFRYAWICGVYI
ncbi:MAG: hypothetical protein HQL12_07010 [Candidatus Omnitrophica bacterium]|nr:hypothetical protein [Candidatus Omnitrophota bacterium]